MKIINIALIIFTVLISGVAIFSQESGKPGVPKNSPTPQRTPLSVPRVGQGNGTEATTTSISTEKLSDILAKNLEKLPKNEEISRERREQAYAKLLEGQRYIWGIKRTRNFSNARNAVQAFQKAVELNPNLAEAYTALAEVTWNTPPFDTDEAVRLASIAIKVDRNNYGANLILARIYTSKSRLNTKNPDENFTVKAIEAWKEITRLDPRNAEAWAFLSELYERTNRTAEKIEALQQWLSSAQPLETWFYRRILGERADLSPEKATIKLATAYLETGKIADSVKLLSQVIADEPDNAEAIELLSKALEKADNQTSASSVQALQQAIYANPGNTSLILLLAKVQTRTGNEAETTRFLAETINKLAEKDKEAAADLQLTLGDLFRDAEKYDEAVKQYLKALTVRGINKENLATDDEREFAVQVYEKVIQTYKIANRFEDARKAIISSQSILGEEDSFTDRQLIDLYRESGKKEEALKAVRAARLRFPDDYGFLRTEALILTGLGKVDEGVALIKALIGKQNQTNPSVMYDDFTNYLFISHLYTEARRGKEAVEAANKALRLVQDRERRQIALVTLATAQYTAGDFAGSEETLRGVLRNSPNNPIALNNLGYFLVERNVKLDEALEMIKKAIEIEPNNSSYLDSLGWAYFKLGKLDLAEEYLKKALKLDPSSATILEHLGDVYQKQGKNELAKQMWQKALNLASAPEQAENLRVKLNKKKSK